MLEDKLGEWVSDAWAQASAIHTCFYEDWCKEKNVTTARKRIEKLVKEAASLVEKRKSDKTVPHTRLI